jgi:hypothetical protein
MWASPLEDDLSAHGRVLGPGQPSRWRRRQERGGVGVQVVCGSKEEDGYRGANPRISSPGLAAQRPLSARGKKRQIMSADGVDILGKAGRRSWDDGQSGRVQETNNPTPLRMDGLA